MTDTKDWLFTIIAPNEFLAHRLRASFIQQLEKSRMDPTVVRTETISEPSRFSIKVTLTKGDVAHYTPVILAYLPKARQIAREGKVSISYEINDYVDKAIENMTESARKFIDEIRKP